MSSNFDRDIKGVPLMGTANPVKPLRRVSMISSSASDITGVNTARKNIMGHQ